MLGRRVELDGEAPGDGDDLLLLRGRAPTPARSSGGSWARYRGENVAGECGGNGEAGEGQIRAREGAARRGRVVAYLGCGGAQRETRGSSSLAAEYPPFWRCTGESGVRERR